MQLFTEIQKEVIARVEGATDSLKIAVTWFTNHDIFDAVLKKLDNKNFEVSLIVLNDRINNKSEGVDFQKLIGKRGNFYFSNTENMVHHKFCIIDNQTVITGSYNWTYYAENRNWENIVILQNPDVVKGYVEEFDKVIKAHDKIEKVAQKVNLKSSLSSEEYLQTDYQFQAESEIKKGNDLAAAKIYTELLRINNNLPVIATKRAEIIKKRNGQRLDVCPFEIGLGFKTGYIKMIPAFSKLPQMAQITGTYPKENLKSLKITVQKNDFRIITLKEFSFDGLQPQTTGTPKVSVFLNLHETGVLDIFCEELNGYGRTKMEHLDLKQWLS